MSASRIGLVLYPGTVVVSGALPGTTAASSGVMAGDRVTMVGDRVVATSADIDTACAEAAPGTTVAVRIERSGQEFTLSLPATGPNLPPGVGLPPPAVSYGTGSTPPPPPSSGKSRRGLVVGIGILALVLVGGLIAAFLSGVIGGGTGRSESYQAGASAGTVYRQALNPADFDTAIKLMPAPMTCQGLLTAWVLEHGSVPGGNDKEWAAGCEASLG